MSSTAAPQALLEQVRQLLSRKPVDEDAVHQAATALMRDYGYTAIRIADETGHARQQLFRILASRREEFAPYLAMCNFRASVVEVLIGMPWQDREALRRQFERTGEPFTQAALRRHKQLLAALREAPRWPTPQPLGAATSDDRHWRQLSADDAALLHSLVRAVAQAHQRARPAAPTQKTVRVSLPEAQARELVRRLGGDAGRATAELALEIQRLLAGGN